MLSTQWEYIPDAQKQNLHFFMSLGITNAITNGILQRALDAVGAQFTTTPTLFAYGTDGYLALLGTCLFLSLL
jgi:hypothetical protein